MKEKVERLAKGIFEYDTPDILLSEEEILISVDAGRSYSGSFTIKNTQNTSLKGVIYSSHHLFYLNQDSFTEAENQITYEFLGEYSKPGETIKGEVCIVSDCGEVGLPFTITIEAPYLSSSLGKVKDLFNFTNLAKADWAEAIKLLRTKEFRQVITYHDAKYLLLHQGLVKSRSASQALEEFLVTVRKKLHVNFIVDKNVLHYNIGDDNVMDKVTLMKDNWGYAEIRVSTDVPFITLDHKIVWSDYFVGNTYPLEFVLNPALMRPGNNYGRIYLTTIHDTMVVEITCKCKKGQKEKRPEYKKYQEYAFKATKNYLSFRLNKLSLEEYVSETVPILQDLMTLADKEKDFYHLLFVHLLIVSDKEEQAGIHLEELQAKAEVWKFTAVVKHCGYLYLRAMHTKESTDIEEALRATREGYEQTSDWRLLWILFYIDKKYDHNRALKLTDIKQQFERGIKSPILYFEAVTVVNEEPVLLHELSTFEIQILNWGTKHGCLKEEAAMLLTYMAGRRKNYNHLVYNCLTRLYDTYQKKDVLSSICSLLIKGHKRNTRFFKWFRLGVEEQLRITELYEYYMYTLDETADVVLPQPVLLYFIYNSNLSDRKKAFLYAYVVKNKEKLPTMYHNYYKRMEQFTLRLLKEHSIHPNLALLYEEVITQQGMTPEFGAELPYVMFKHEICCNNPGIKGVCVIHKELEEEVYVPLTNGCVQVDIFTGNAEILLVDTLDNRYSTTVDYTLNKLLPWEYYGEISLTMNVVHPMLLLNLSEKAQTYQKFDEQSVEIRKLLLQVKGLTGTYYSKILLDLIQYYYDNFQGEHLEAYLQEIDLRELKKDDRNKLIEILLIRDHYKPAQKAIWEFGYDGIAMKRLIKLCTHLLQETQEEEKHLIKLAFHIFKEGKYNEEILLYLVENYNGTTEDMYKLWEAAAGFELNTASLEERLLGQILFAESYLVKGMDVFLKYYKRGSNHKLIRGFLSYYAYKYVVMDRLLPTELFNIMKKELVYEDNEICMLALLKEYSKQEQYTENDLELIDYNLHQFVKRGIVLPFFKKFEEVLTLSPGINDRYYIEYITNPANKVIIHYRLEGKNSTGEFFEEEMKNVYLGIHVKEFILFCNESIQYYISEEDSKGQILITESVTVLLGQDMKLEEDTRYNQLNFMLTALEMQDDKTLLECIKKYSLQQSACKELFKPL